MILKYFGFFILFSAFASISYAQNDTTIIKVPKFKPPVVKTFLGDIQNGAQVTADQGKHLIGLPLDIKDDKNNSYAIDSYQFLYKQKSYTLNDETGKRDVNFSITSARFDSASLPKVWVDNIRRQLQPDEQLYFFDIVVKDKEGRKFFAPELKITIK